MAININVGMLGANETKTVRAMWNLTNKVVLSQTTALPGSPTDGDIYIVPSGGDAKKIAFRSEGAWLYLVPEAGWFAYVVDDNMLMYYDGAAWTEFQSGGGGAGGDTIELSLFTGGLPTASETLSRHEFTTATSFPDSLFGSHGSSGIAATASTVLSIQKNGIQFGTATWSAAGTEPAFVATATAFAASDILSVVAPVTPDATLADISLTFIGLLAL
jgi:Protein of unknown function (DUF2793)